MRALIDSAIAMLRNAKLVVLHLAGNIVLLLAATLWLLIPEAHIWQLIATFILGVAILFCALWLHCGTLAFGHNPTRGELCDGFRRSLRRIPLFALVAVVLILLMHWSDTYGENSWEISGYFYTKMPHFLQRMWGEQHFHNWVEFKLAAMTWFLIPALLLPFLSLVAGSEFSRRSFRATLCIYARWRYWLACAVASGVGVWLPAHLIHWTPGHTLTAETVSMVLRLLAAYALATAAWLMISGVVGGYLCPPAVEAKSAAGVPSESQRSSWLRP